MPASSLSPVQLFAALAAGSGDLRQAFYDSGLRARLDAPFSGLYSKVYSNRFETVSHLSAHNYRPLTGWDHTHDSVYFVDPLKTDPAAVFELSRRADANRHVNWGYWVSCRARSREISGPALGNILAIEEVKTGQGPQLVFSHHRTDDTNFSNVFRVLALVDRIMAAKPQPAARLL